MEGRESEWILKCEGGRGAEQCGKQSTSEDLWCVPRADRAAPAHYTHPILSNALGTDGFGHLFNKQKYRTIYTVNQIAAIDLDPPIHMNSERAYLARIRDIFIIAEC